MLEAKALKQLLHHQDFSRLEKLLFCLAVDADSPKSVKQVRGLATEAGLTAAKKWNVSGILASSKGLAIRTSGGWELSPQGRAQVGALGGSLVVSPATHVAASLRRHLKSISNPDVEAFLTEAIGCYEHDFYRAAVVLSWVGAISLLQEFVVQNHLKQFNAEAKRRNPKWKDVKNRDGLSRIKEYDFLQILEAISVFGKGAKQELEKRLQLRNSCGHPDTLKIGENAVAAHIEVLILNVFAKFSI